MGGGQTHHQDLAELLRVRLSSGDVALEQEHGVVLGGHHSVSIAEQESLVCVEEGGQQLVQGGCVRSLIGAVLLLVVVVVLLLLVLCIGRLAGWSGGVALQEHDKIAVAGGERFAHYQRAIVVIGGEEQVARVGVVDGELVVRLSDERQKTHRRQVVRTGVLPVVTFRMMHRQRVVIACQIADEHQKAVTVHVGVDDEAFAFS
mmetsp:Transcript_42800/g.108039  ORF Transcript_42800/g.108039 Transcript_42800/m.108039 type:complete len:203 (+) Transcript_42800:2154-2762(+)